MSFKIPSAFIDPSGSCYLQYKISGPAGFTLAPGQSIFKSIETVMTGSDGQDVVLTRRVFPENKTLDELKRAEANKKRHRLKRDSIKREKARKNEEDSLQGREEGDGGPDSGRMRLIEQTIYIARTQ